MKKIIATAAAILLTILGLAAVAHAAPSAGNVLRTVIPEADNTYDLGASGDVWRSLYIANSAGSTRCLQVTSAGLVQTAAAACGSGSGGGSGVSPWGTTTSAVPAWLINYSLNNTDIVTIGDSSTSSAKFIFDPNSQIGYFSGNVGIRTKSPTYPLDVVGLGHFSGLVDAQRFVATSSSLSSSFPNASTTALTVAGAGGLYVGTLTGPLQAIAGQVTASSTLSVFYGGTGATTLTGCLTGNGQGAITGSGTCNTSNATVSSVGLSSTNSTLTIGATPVTTSGTITADLNLGHANTWTGKQTFNTSAIRLGTVTGSNQCLHSDTNGDVTGTGSDCSSGTVGAGVAGQLAFYAANGTTVSGTSTGIITVSALIASSTLSTTTIAGPVSIDAGANTPPGNAWFNVGSSTPRLFVDKITGNVGIGTSRPNDVNVNAKLTVAGLGAVSVSASTTDDTTSTASIFDAYAAGSRAFIGAHGQSQVSTQYGTAVGGFAEIAGIANTFGTFNGLMIGTRTAVTPIIFGNNNLERMRIAANGNIGIGLTTPNLAKLEVQGTTTAAGVPLAIWNSAATGLLIVKDSGNVGVGSTTPGSLLSIGNTNGWNFSATGTSTSQVSAGGINLMNGGCFAIAGTCISGGGGSGSGTVNAGVLGQLAFYAANGATVSGSSTDQLTIGVIHATSTSGTSNFMGNFGIGTGTPMTGFAVGSSISTTTIAGDLTLGATAASSTFYMDKTGHMFTGGTQPTCTSGCAAAPSMWGDDNTFRVLLGTSITSATITFANSWMNSRSQAVSPSCNPTDESGVTTGIEASSTPTTVILSLPTALTGKYVTVQCRASDNMTF